MALIWCSKMNETEKVEDMFAPEELCEELSEYIEDCSIGGLMIRHPLVYSVPYFPPLNKQLNLSLKYKQEALDKALREENWGSYIFLHERPHRFNALNEIHKSIKKEKEYWELFVSIFVDSECLWAYDKYIKTILKKGMPNPHYVMNEEDLAIYDNLPDTLRIYRGYTKGSEYCNRQGYSWTLNYNTANFFSNRLKPKDHKPGVVSGMVNKKDIVLFTNRRSELEIVVDPRKVKSKKEYKPMRRDGWLKEIWKITTDHFALGIRSYHGPSHWANVERNGIYLSARTGADITVVLLFAAIHDCCRVNENDDPEHGPKAAEFAKKLFDEGKIRITQEQMDKLYKACHSHQLEKLNDDPTIGTCWDADRLDLVRVGEIPNVEYFSTEYGREMVREKSYYTL